MAKAIGILGKTIAVAMATFVLLEMSFRLYHYINPVFVFPDNSDNRFRGKPFAPDFNFNLNSLGFKDVEFNKEKAPVTLRIAAIGDSFVFGAVPYQYNFLTLLEERLNANGSGRHFEVFNMGIPRTSPREYLSVLIKEALPLNPDVILVCVFVGNDFIEISRKPVLQHSFVIAFIKYLYDLQQHVKGNMIPAGRTHYDDDAATMSAEYFLEIEVGRSEIYIKGNKTLHERLPRVMDYMREIREVCNRNKMELFVVVIPDEVQVDSELQAKVVNVLRLDRDSVDFSLPNIMLDVELGRLDINYIDLLEPFRAITREKRLYKPQDTHWNILGNQTAARFLEDFLRKAAAYADKF
jgi:hypothetical protein